MTRAALTVIALVTCLMTLPSLAADRDKFIGTWKLVSIEDHSPDRATSRFQFGPHPIGYIMYDRSEHMCVQIVDPDRAKWVSAEETYRPTESELRSAADGSVAYCGRYEVNQKEKFVVHHVELEFVPNEIGADRKRQYRFSGNRLELSPTPDLKLTWERVEVVRCCMRTRAE